MQKASGWITALGTPRAENASGGSSPHVSSLATPAPSSGYSSSSSAQSSFPSTSPIKTIKAYGGEDISSMVGNMISLLGHAKGINDESVDSSARFVWNFGDGETQEGRSVAHIYRIPGTYMLGLYVSLGEYTASDYMRVQISPNFVDILGVVLGADGYIKLANASDTDADISGWSVHDATGRQFIMPSHTLMARRGDIAIPNSVSGLLRESDSLPLSVLYPNGIPAFAYVGTTSAIAAAAERKAPQEEMSPLPVPSVSFSGDVLALHLPKSSASPFLNPSPSPDAKEYASAGSIPSVSIPFMIAVGVSALGAIGFLISKKFLS